MKRFLLLAVLMLPLMSSCGEENPVPDIIPVPSSVRMGAGHFLVPANVEAACGDSSFFAAADFLKMTLDGCLYADGTTPEGGCTVNMTAGKKGDIVFVHDGSLEPDGEYVLDVTEKGIRIACGSYSGAVAAVATLGQIVSGGKVPVCRIEDSPRFAWRGFMLDVSRHFFTPAEVKALLAKLAQYKFNKFHWHLTDDQGWRVEIKSRPELTSKGGFRDPALHNHDIMAAKRAADENDPTSLLPQDRLVSRDGKTLYGGYYTQDEIRDIVAYAASLGMDVIPEIDMPGHSLNIIESYPELSCSGRAVWGKDFSVPLCPGNDATIRFAKDVYNEIFGLFPYGYVHIGADEVEKSHWAACPKCQARKAEYGLADEHDLQDWFVKELENFCNENGKTIIGWDEIASKPEFSKDAVVQWWRPWVPATKENAVKNGNGIILCPNEFYYMDLAQNRNTLMKVYCHEPVDEILYGHEDQVLGVHGNLWTEYVTSFEGVCDRLFPRMFAVSETAWSEPEKKDAADFNRRVIAHLEKLDECGWNYRIPDPDGFCDLNVFTDSAVVSVTVPFDGVVVRYTSDGSVPGPDSDVMDGPMTIKEDCILKIRPFTSSGIGGQTYTARWSTSDYVEPAFGCLSNSSCGGCGESSGCDAGAAYPEGCAAGLMTWRFDGKFPDCMALSSAAPDAEFVSETVVLPAEPSSDFGLMFKGYVRIPEDGIWSFYTYTDDGSVMTISGRTAVENDGLHSRDEKSGQVALRKGWHPIEIRYFDHGGGFMEAGFILPDGTRRPFTKKDLCYGGM